MSTTIPLAFTAGDEPSCEPCVQSAGLCRFHAEHDHQLMPLLREPSWHRHVHRGENSHGEKQAPDPEAEKIKARKARKRARAANRLERSINGEFTRSRIAA